jgi:hypothetical protein
MIIEQDDPTQLASDHDNNADYILNRRIEDPFHRPSNNSHPA